MNKRAFLTELKAGLSGLPREDIDERLNFYSEMIDDRIEEGLSEEEAIAQIGTVNEIVSQTATEIPKPGKAGAGPKQTLRVWEVILLALGSPVWLSLLIAGAALILAFYAVSWSVVVSLWAVETSLLAGSFVGAASAVVFAFGGNGLTGLAILGAGLVCAGLSIFLFFGCRTATRGGLLLTKEIGWKIKSLFTGREAMR